MRTYGRLLRYIANIKSEIMIKTLLGVLISATHIAQAIFMSRVVGMVWQHESIGRILPQICLVLLFVLVRSLLLREVETYGKVLAARIKSKLRLVVLNKIFDLGPGYLNSRRTGKLSSLILDGIESLEPFFVNYIPHALTSLLCGAFIFVYLCGFDAVGSCIMLLSVVLCIGIPMITVPLINKTVTGYWSEYSVLTSQYIDTIQGITALKTLNAEQSKGAELEKNATAFYKKSIRNTGISLTNSAILLVLAAVISSITVIIVALRVDQGLAPAASVTAFLFLAGECSRLMVELNRYWHSSFLGLSVAKDLFELIEKRPDVADCSKPDANSLDGNLPSIDFKNVRFSYPTGTQAVKDVTASIPSGATFAVVGRSGAGKSTLLNLLLRFYDVVGGAILINGVDVRKYSLEYLRRNIAVVFQDSFLFCGTIADNIKMARPDATDDEMIAAAKAANAHDFISALPQGYQTIVGERGMTLSGGERQRISIARAVLKKAPILLLDEASSSVDAKSEALIQSALSEMIRTHTTIIIAHRLSTIQKADMILVLDEGRLVERGTHSELIAAKGAYSKLIQAQEEAIR